MDVEGSDSPRVENSSEGLSTNNLLSSDSPLLAAENWLSSDDFSVSLRRIYDRAVRGASSSDRNISFDIFLECAQKLHSDALQLSVEAAYLPLQLYLPEPDVEFITNSLQLLRASQKHIEDSFAQKRKLAEENGKQIHLDEKSGADLADLAFEAEVPSVLELQRQGVPDYEQFEELMQAVYVQMAHCAELVWQKSDSGTSVKVNSKEEESERQKERDFSKKMAVWDVNQSRVDPFARGM